MRGPREHETMSIVVEQTIPFSREALDVENPTRWIKLLPLVRPSFRAIQVQDHTILVDEALKSSQDVRVAIIGRHGNFSSKVLESRHVCAVAFDATGKSTLDAAHMMLALGAAGFEPGPGSVVLRCGRQRRATRSNGILTVEVEGCMALDHLLHLIGCSTAETRASFQATADMVWLFLMTATIAHSTFDGEMSEASPMILHADGECIGFEKAKDAIQRDLKHVMKLLPLRDVPVTYSVHFSDVNGLSRHENYTIGLEIGSYLESQGLSYVISSSTILLHDDLARGYLISMSMIPQQYLEPQAKATNPLIDEQAYSTGLTRVDSKYMRFSDGHVRACIQRGCDAVILEEPTITRYDEIVGDGDCGFTLRDGAKQVLRFVSDTDLSDLPQVMAEMVHDLETNMGGTSGALYCIFLAAFSASLATNESLPGALNKALQELLKYTRAREGDRTMMDCLIPFTETFVKTGDVQAALLEARKGVDSTRTMEAKLGRSSYLDRSATRGVPDPGAYGLLVLLEGMCKV